MAYLMSNPYYPFGFPLLMDMPDDDGGTTRPK